MKRNLKQYVAVLLILMFAFTACTSPSTSPSTTEQTETTANTEASTNTQEQPSAQDTEEATESDETTDTDRAGNPITLPDNIERVISFAPSMTQVIEELGFLDKLVAVDTQSPKYVDGVDGLPQFNMMTPDIEALAALEPDVMFVSGMSLAKGDNPFEQLVELGICVIMIPSSTSIEGVKEDNQFIADVMGASAKGQEINQKMQERIDAIAAIGTTIEDKKTVMFEIAALPNIYSFGQETFLHEMIELIGANNAFADEESWISVSEEAAVAKNPDVILTNVSYIEDSVGEILARTGWENVKAVQEKNVYYIDNGKSSLSNHHIVEALEEMAKAVYPDEYSALSE
ncbi:ABC transporter substrate-binding protein [Vallitaleaceae bacterium 9-2]|mgnify:CR=1 FL=1